MHKKVSSTSNNKSDIMEKYNIVRQRIQCCAAIVLSNTLQSYPAMPLIRWTWLNCNLSGKLDTTQPAQVIQVFLYKQQNTHLLPICFS